jgi:uncharacterized membrane protein
VNRAAFPPPNAGAERLEVHTPAVLHRGGPGPDTLFGLSFASLNRAQQFLLAINGLAHDHRLRLLDAVLLVRGRDARVRVRETIDPQPGKLAVSGAIWAGLLGLIIGGAIGWFAGIGVGAAAGYVAARIIDRGVPDDWVAWFKLTVPPDSATVVVLANTIDQKALGEEVDRFPGARLVHTTIHADAFSQLRSAFSDRPPSGLRTSDV